MISPPTASGRTTAACLLALATLVLACDGSNPVAPTPIVSPENTTYTITLLATTGNGQVEIGDKRGVKIEITVTSNVTGGNPLDGIRVTLSTSLGNFGTSGAAGDTQQTISSPGLEDGRTSVTFYPGDKTGEAQILAALNSSAGKLNLEIVAATPPVAAFSFKATGLTATFADGSTGAPDKWIWNFGDGRTKREQNPIHKYKAAGNYPVSLTVTKGTGVNKATSTKTQIVTAGGEIKEPVAGFSFKVDLLTVTFADTSTNNPTKWRWDFGDGRASTKQNPSHPYREAGNYTVKLTAENAAGSNSKSQIVTVGGDELAPKANFTFAVSGLTVTFADTSTDGPTSWRWDFGGAGTLVSRSTTRSQNPTFKYASAGNYTVRLTATNDAGSSNKSQIVTAEESPTSAFEFSVSDKTVSFVNKSAGTPAPTFQWSFGDGTSSTDTDPIHTYADYGVYTVTLIATNTTGSTVSSSTVTVGGLPVAAFSVTVAAKIATFVNTSSGTPAPTSFLWEFGDGTGSSSAVTPPPHTYAASGSYPVKLTATNLVGSHSVTLTVVVP